MYRYEKSDLFGVALSLCVCIFFLPLLCHKYSNYIAVSVEYFRGLVIFLPYCVRCIAIDIIEVYSIFGFCAGGALVNGCGFHLLSVFGVYTWIIDRNQNSNYLRSYRLLRLSPCNIFGFLPFLPCLLSFSNLLQCLVILQGFGSVQLLLVCLSF